MGQQCMSATNQNKQIKKKAQGINSTKNSDLFKGYEPVMKKHVEEQKKPLQNINPIIEEKQPSKVSSSQNPHNIAYVQIPSILSKSNVKQDEKVQPSFVSSQKKQEKLQLQNSNKGTAQKKKTLLLPPSSIEEIHSIKDSQMPVDKANNCSKLSSSRWLDEVIKRPVLIDTDFKQQYFDKSKITSNLNNNSFISQNQLIVHQENKHDLKDEFQFQEDQKNTSCQCSLFGYNLVASIFKTKPNKIQQQQSLIVQKHKPSQKEKEKVSTAPQQQNKKIDQSKDKEKEKLTMKKQNSQKSNQQKSKSQLNIRYTTKEIVNQKQKVKQEEIKNLTKTTIR